MTARLARQSGFFRTQSQAALEQRRGLFEAALLVRQDAGVMHGLGMIRRKLQNAPEQRRGVVEPATTLAVDGERERLFHVDLAHDPAWRLDHVSWWNLGHDVN